MSAIMMLLLKICVTISVLQPHLTTAVLHSDSLYDGVDQALIDKWKVAVRDRHQRSERSIEDSYANITNVKDPRFLSLFTLIQFENKECTGSSGSGVCYTSSECSSKGGTNTGSCAFGYGVCCYFSITCGGSTSQNCTYLESPNYPDSYTDARSCTMTFTKATDTCQLRMDFVEFTSAQPTAEGKCETDEFTVSKDRKFRYLCGDAPSNWHFYLDVKQESNPISFDFLTTTTGTSRKFKIKISMIPCNLRVPSGCGQYFTTDTGAIQTFNFGSGAYMADQNYAICIRKNKGKCKVTLDRVSDSYVNCNHDMYRQPIGETPTDITIFPVLNEYFGFCQLAVGNTNIKESVTTSTNGPVSLYLYTQFDAVTNMLGTVSGVSQTFTQNTC